MPKPRAKSKPRKKAVKKKATRTTKLHRGGELPSNPNVIDQYRPGGYGGPRPGERIPGPREFPGTRTAEGFEPYVPGGGSSYTPYDSPGGQFRTPPSPWQQGPTPPAYGAPQGLGGRYGGTRPVTTPGGGWQREFPAGVSSYAGRQAQMGPERPTGGATYGGRGYGTGQRELEAYQSARLGTGIGGQAPWRQLEQPPRRPPPPPIRPGYQGGGELVDPNPFPFPGGIAGGPGGWRPRRPNVPLPPGARRRRGRGRGGRDV